MMDNGYAFGTSEQECTEGLKAFCEVESRAELKDNRQARERFKELKERFENESF
jgi:hypothetical protein